MVYIRDQRKSTVIEEKGSFEWIKNLLRSLEPTIPKKKVLSIVKSIIDSSFDAEDYDNAIQEESLTNLILSYKFGDFGKEFFGEYLEKRKSKYKEM
jgi:hypothetical protein